MNRITVTPVGLTQPDKPVEGDRLRANLDSIHAALNRVSRHDPDLVVFPELVLQRRDSRNPEIACTVPGPETDELGERAREVGAHVVVPMSERDGERLYNAAVMIDDTGEVLDPYHKIRPTIGEIEAGKTPGTETTVWDTPFGRVGAAICFDIHFQEVATSLAARRADIVVFPSAMAGDEMLRAWAINHGFTVIQSTRDETAVYTPGGARLAANDDRNYALRTDFETGASARIGVAEVNTDRAQIHLDTIINEYEAIAERYGEDLRIHKCSTEAYVLLESVGEVSVEAVIEEFDLETKQSYIERSRRAAIEARPDYAIEDTDPALAPELDN